jgi:heme exporter protein CcmD
MIGPGFFGLGAPDLGPHAAYILASYVVAGLVFGWMIATSIIANRSAARRLGAIEADNDNNPAMKPPEVRR